MNDSTEEADRTQRASERLLGKLERGQEGSLFSNHGFMVTSKRGLKPAMLVVLDETTFLLGLNSLWPQ